ERLPDGANPIKEKSVFICACLERSRRVYLRLQRVFRPFDSSTVRRFNVCRVFLLVITSAFSAFSAFSAVEAAARVECRTVASKALDRDVRYCAILPPSYDDAASKARRYPVLYFLHGLGDNEQSLVNFGGWNIVENLQDARRIGEYIVVTPDAGRSFYINSRDGRNRYEDFFIKEFLPAIERRYRIQADRAHRGIAGISMGGYGALRLAFKYPALFASVSAHSAALMQNLPRVYTDRRTATGSVAPNSPRIQSRLALMGSVFGSPLDPAFYEQQSPFTLARRQPLAALKRLRIYFDCGTEDDFGFHIGARALHELLDSRGIAHEFHLYPGGHSPLYFAEHLPATFLFHSATFGLKEREAGVRGRIGPTRESIE
ncbi:MAG: alpha/beta hydrolase, partial [Candidatus Acidiferrales bacterium]